MVPVVAPLSWLCFPAAKIVTAEGASGDDAVKFVSGVGVEHQKKSKLPPEFFSHELFDFDLSQDDEVLGFVQSWGMLVSPLRYSANVLAEIGVQDMETGEVAKFLGRSWLDEYLSMAETDGLGESRAYCVSLEETRNAIRRLRETSLSVQKIALAKSDDDLTLIDIYNWVIAERAATRQSVPRLGEDVPHRNLFSLLSPFRDANLTHAICNQMDSFLADEAPARVCACEGCGRIFKRKRGSASNLASAVSDYCSVRCENRQRQRRYRQGKSANIAR